MDRRSFVAWLIGGAALGHPAWSAAQERNVTTQQALPAASLQPKLLKAHDDLKALAKRPMPKDLSPEDQQHWKAISAHAGRRADAFRKLAAEAKRDQGDLGQKLQFQLQEANNIYTRASKAQSDVVKKYNDAVDSIIRNIKG